MPNKGQMDRAGLVEMIDVDSWTHWMGSKRGTKGSARCCTLEKCSKMFLVGKCAAPRAMSDLKSSRHLLKVLEGFTVVVAPESLRQGTSSMDCEQPERVAAGMPFAEFHKCMCHFPWFMLVVFFGGQEHTCRVVISDQSGLLPVPKGEGKWARPDNCCLGSGWYVETLSIVERTTVYMYTLYIIYHYFDVNLLGTLLFPEMHMKSRRLWFDWLGVASGKPQLFKVMLEPCIRFF